MRIYLLATYVILIVQVICALFFVIDLVATFTGYWSLVGYWAYHDFLEISATIGLVLGAVFGFITIRKAHEEQTRAENALRSVRGDFCEVVNEKMKTWALTDAEKDVAWFAIKGFSLTEIADFRSTSVGTIKAQNNAIYAKAGVTGRSQLLAILVDDLLMRD